MRRVGPAGEHPALSIAAPQDPERGRASCKDMTDVSVAAAPLDSADTEQRVSLKRGGDPRNPTRAMGFRPKASTVSNS